MRIHPRTTSTATSTSAASTTTSASTHTTSTNATHATHGTTKSAPLPQTTTPSWKSVSHPAASREIVGHARELGVHLDGVDDVAHAIQQAELKVGQGFDERVSSADMQRAIGFAQHAAQLRPARQRDLFGFTRVVDQKAELAPSTLASLADACGDKEALLRAIDRGPGKGDIAWSQPQTPVELVASIVRQLALGGGASKQLTISPELAAWMAHALEGAHVDVKTAMGGAGAFAANLAAAVGVESTFFSADPIPHAIADRFASGVKLVDKNAHTSSAHDKDEANASVAARTNTSLEYASGAHFALFGGDDVVINGKARRVDTEGTGRVILGTKAKDVKPGFDGVSDSALKQIARDNDVFFFVGAHYLTQTPDDAPKLAAALSTMKKAHPSIVLHAQYVVPKVLESEAAVWGALKGSLDSLALNSVEVAPFLDSLHEGGLSSFAVEKNVPKEAAEDASHMLDGALAIADSLSLKRVALHGMEGDLVVSKPGMPGADDPNRQRQALLKARMIAANKTANESGEIKSSDDVWPVLPSVRGRGLAALHRFADAVQERFQLTNAERDLVVERWWVRAPDGTTIHFVPSRGIHDRSGGTVSLGDTIDSAALLYAVQPKRAPAIKHGSSFT